MSLVVTGLLVGCGDQLTEVVPERHDVQLAPSFESVGTGPTVSTDKPDYQPGDTVVVSGSGWWAGETVSLLIEEDPETAGPHLYSAVADAEGNFEARTLVISDQHLELEVTFTLTATGESSGATAQTTFTDHGPSPVTSSGFTITANASFLVTVSVTLGGGSTTVTLSAATAKVANQTLGTTIDVALTGPGGGSGNGSWSGSFQGDCATQYKINNIAVTWTTTHDHNSTETPGATTSVTTGTCPPSNRPPTVDAEKDADPNAYSGDEGSAISIIGDASDPDGDVVTTTWSVDDGGYGITICTIADPSSLSTTVTCTDNGTFTLTLSGTDGKIATPVTSTATLTVANVAPVITSLSVSPALVSVGTLVTLSGAFTDDGANDTHTASIDWDDGTSADPGTVTEASGTVSKTHTYAATGIYAVSLTVTDDDNGFDTEVFEYVVVYDPTAGFVTGGGWIWSPLGACPTFCNDATGKAHFGFVSKYQKGATTPVGNTEFQFQAGGLNFSSTSYDWLVVQSNSIGGKATYKGYGSVNGVSGYGFLLSAIDGSPDKFRIKIWEVGGDVIYDNQVTGGTGDNADPSTALADGSIVIHVPKAK